MKQILIIAVLIAGASGLSCICNPKNLTAHCGPPPTCQGSVIKDACGCCDACAKVEGEKCGGPWNISGKCDTELVCHKKLSGPKPIFTFVDFNAEGTCEYPDDAEECDD